MKCYNILLVMLRQKYIYICIQKDGLEDQWNSSKSDSMEVKAEDESM